MLLQLEAEAKLSLMLAVDEWAELSEVASSACSRVHVPVRREMKLHL